MENAEEQITQKLDPVMKEGQRLEADLQEKIGQAPEGQMSISIRRILRLPLQESQSESGIFSKSESSLKRNWKRLKVIFKASTNVILNGWIWINSR
jgi:hypothetical protein